MNKRLAAALAAFAALGVIASFVLHGWPLRVVLILFGYFAVRTVIAGKIQSLSEPLRDDLSQTDTESSNIPSEPEQR